MVDISTYYKNIERWEHEYIEDADLSKITWQKLSSLEMKKFYLENYLDQQTGLYVINVDIDLSAPIGLKYATTEYFEEEETRFFGTVPNNKGTNTIVAYLSMYEKFCSPQYGYPLTFINFVEVNKYFQHQGLLGRMAEEFPKHINLYHDIIITEESTAGKEHHVHDHLLRELKAQGFKKKFIV